MATEIVGKFKKGDRVVIAASREDSPTKWYDGCEGTVKGIWVIGSQVIPDYLVSLKDSPSAYIRDIFVSENDLRAK